MGSGSEDPSTSAQPVRNGGEAVLPLGEAVFAMGGEAAGGQLGVWGEAPSRWKHGGLGAEPPALENFAFFCKNNLILELF